MNKIVGYVDDFEFTVWYTNQQPLNLDTVMIEEDVIRGMCRLVNKGDD